MKYRDYEHHAKYYETDQMGIVHHSNFIRWMEEARVDMLDQIGMNFRRVEEAGLVSPVLAVSGEYRRMVHFDDTVVIHTALKEYGGLRFAIGYEMRLKDTGEVCFVGESRHCFLTREGRPASLKRVRPDWDAILRKLLEAGTGDSENNS